MLECNIARFISERSLFSICQWTKVQSANAIKRVCVRINKRARKLFSWYFFGSKRYRINHTTTQFHERLLAAEDITEVEDISEPTTSDMTDDFSKLHETHATDEDMVGAVSDIKKERRVISYPYRKPSALDGASMKRSGTCAHSNILQKGRLCRASFKRIWWIDGFPTSYGCLVR